MSDLCTIHQMLTADGLPHVTGSEVRTPSGEVLPYVSSVTTKAVAGEIWWETNMTLRTRFGDPLRAESKTGVSFAAFAPDKRAGRT